LDTQYDKVDDYIIKMNTYIRYTEREVEVDEDEFVSVRIEGDKVIKTFNMREMERDEYGISPDPNFI